MIRRRVLTRYLRDLRVRSEYMTDHDLELPAVVLAPHPDDETLGCGGLIAMKRRAGTDVHVVFLTDGAGSHAHLMDRGVLAERRRDEARQACAALGVAPDAVHFLGFADGHLHEHLDEASRLLAPLLRSERVEQMVLPHPAEPPSDHAAAFVAAGMALGERAHDLPALCYPVWLWDQWPWTNPLAAPRARSSLRRVASTGLHGRLGRRLIDELDQRLDISSVIEQKRRALESHRTQMTRIGGDLRWSTLPDVANGEWLGRLTSHEEFFASLLLPITSTGSMP